MSSFQALLLAFLNPRYRHICESTVGIIFFATPHQGSESSTCSESDTYRSVFTRVASIFTNEPNAQLLSALQTNSDELLRLSSDFKCQLGKCHVVSLYEMKWTDTLKALVSFFCFKSGCTYHLALAEVSLPDCRW